MDKRLSPQEVLESLRTDIVPALEKLRVDQVNVTKKTRINTATVLRRVIPLSGSAALFMLSLSPAFAAPNDTVVPPSGQTMPVYHPDDEQPKVDLPHIDIGEDKPAKENPDIPVENPLPIISDHAGEQDEPAGDHSKSEPSQDQPEEPRSDIDKNQGQDQEGKKQQQKHLPQIHHVQKQFNLSVPKEIKRNQSTKTEPIISHKEHKGDSHITKNTNVSAVSTVASAEETQTKSEDFVQAASKESTDTSSEANSQPVTKDNVALPKTASPLIPMAIRGAAIALFGLGIYPRKKK